jgi:hypothetical protein
MWLDYNSSDLYTHPTVFSPKICSSMSSQTRLKGHLKFDLIENLDSDFAKANNRQPDNQPASTKPVYIIIMLPSAYITDKTRTLAEKLIHNSQQAHPSSITSLFPHVTSRLPLDSPLFAPTPANIVIQNFVPFQEYEIHVGFKNMDSVPRKLRLVHLDHPCFTLVVCSLVGLML